MLTTLPNRVSALFADPLHTVLRELDRDLTWNGNGPNCQSRKVAPMSMWSDNNSVFIELDVPGISISELQVSVENGKLTIRGERKTPDYGDASSHEERSFGGFERTIVLNDRVDANSIDATLRDGVLRLKLSKKLEAQKQTITINYVDPSSESAKPSESST